VIAVAPPVQSIRDLGLPTQVVNFLADKGVTTVAELTRLTAGEMLGSCGFGRKSLQDVRRNGVHVVEGMPRFSVLFFGA